MIIDIVSLILIFIENSLPLDSELMAISLPFITYIIGKRRSSFCLLLTYIFMSLQSDRYFFNLFILTAFIAANYFLFSYIEYSKKVVFYLAALDLAFYLIFVLKSFDLIYLLVNLISFIILNYFYATGKSKKENKWNLINIKEKLY